MWSFDKISIFSWSFEEINHICATYWHCFLFFCNPVMKFEFFLQSFVKICDPQIEFTLCDYSTKFMFFPLIFSKKIVFFLQFFNKICIFFFNQPISNFFVIVSVIWVFFMILYWKSQHSVIFRQDSHLFHNCNHLKKCETKKRILGEF